MIGYLLEFALQTAFLTAALWIMIKLQKLDYKFLGLIAAAAVATVVGMVLDEMFSRMLGAYFGMSISSFIVVIVLSVCVYKVTRAEATDVAFTVGVGYALTFCMNLFLLSALLGDLRPSHFGNDDLIPVAARSDDEEAEEIRANTPAELIHKPKVAQSTNVVASASEPLSKSFAVRGITRNASRPSVVLEASGKQYTLFSGDMVMMKITRGFVAVQFKGLDHDQVLLNVEGEEVKLTAE